MASVEGMSFSISADVAQRVAALLEQSGVVVRAQLGITVQDVRTVNSVTAFSSGVYVSGVTVGGASSGLLEVGDVIVQVNEQTTVTPAALMDALLYLNPNQSVIIYFYRQEDYSVLRNVTVVLQSDE